MRVGVSLSVLQPCRVLGVPGSGLHRDETAFNPSLGRALRHRNVQARITAETSGQMESALDQPDITVRRAGREPRRR